MITEITEKIVVIPPHWKVGKIENMALAVDIEGHTQVNVPFTLFADGALRQLRAIYLGRIHNLVIERASVYKYVASVNGELDKRKNAESCKE